MTDPNIDALDALHAKATAGRWYHYDEVFRPQFGRGRITEIQQANGRPIVAWSGFDGLKPAEQRKRNANAASIVALHNAWPAVSAKLRAQQARIAALEGALREVLAVADAPGLSIKNPTTPADWVRTASMHLGAKMLDVFPKVRAALKGTTDD